MSRKTRKLIWSAPLVATLAIVGVLAVFMALAPNDAAAQDINPPGMPSNLKATADGPTSIELTWDEPDTGGEAIGFRVDASDDGTTWRSLESSHPDPRYVHEGLLARQRQYYRVFAFNSDGASLLAGPISATTAASTKPEPPTNLGLTLPDVRGADEIYPQEQIILMWDPPEDPEGAPVTHFRIERSKTGTRWANLEAKIAIDDKKLTFATEQYSYTNDGLLEHQIWYYRVSAINSVGESKTSNAPKTPTEDGVPPGLPLRLFAGINPESERTIWLYWDAPEDDPSTTDADESDPAGAPITGYLIQGRPHNGTDALAWSADPTKNLLIQIGETTDFEITKSEFDKVKVDISVPPDGKSDIIKRWEFRVFAVNTVVERTLDTPALKIDQLAADPLPADGFNASNTIDITPVDLKDDGADQPVAETDDDLMTPPTGLTAKRDSTVKSGRAQVTLKWKAPNTLSDHETPVQIARADTVYRVEFSIDRIGWSLVAEPAENAELTVNHMPLFAGTKYYYRVFAKQSTTDPVNGEAYTWASHPIASVATAPALRPEPPTGLEADTVGHTQIDLLWTPPGPDGSDAVGNGKIKNYLIEYSMDGSSWDDLATIGRKNDKIYTFDGTKVSDRDGGTDDEINFEHTKLMPGVQIHYRISTINNAPANQRESRPSDSVIGMTEPASEPDAPGGLVVQAESHNSIKLSWNEQSADTAAAPTNGYRIDKSDDEGGTWTTLVADTGSTATVYTDSSLSPEMTRHYRVYAINSVGTSPGFTGFNDGIDLTNDNDAMATTLERPNTAPTAGAAIADQTVMVDATVMVQSTITDADTGDTLTWTVMSNMPTYATADGGHHGYGNHHRRSGRHGHHHGDRH